MKTTQIHITYEEEKLDALKMYLAQKNLNLDAELQSMLDTLYHRHVPSMVRDFITMRGDGNPEPVVPKPKRPKSTPAPSVEVTEP